MFALRRWVQAASNTLGSDANRSRRRWKPEVAPLEERTALSAAAGVHAAAAVAATIHPASAVRFVRDAHHAHPHHGTHVTFPGGSVISIPGGRTTVTFPGGMVTSIPVSTVVNFPGGFVNTGAGGTVVSFPGGSVVIG
jgi:hypothetical protein